MLGYIISDKKKINIKDYKIQSFDVLCKTNLNIFVLKDNFIIFKNEIINNACYFGYPQILEWFKKSGYNFVYDEDDITTASEKNNIEILEWFKNSGYEFRYNTCSLYWASWNGNIKILNWFKNNYKLKYDIDAIKDCFNLNVLNFWIKNINIKKIIKCNKKKSEYYKTLKFKTKNNYIKGYNKN
jgi:hypothetical protein